MKFCRNLTIALVLAQAIGLQMNRRVHADTSSTGLNLGAARPVAAVYRGSASAVRMLHPGMVSPVSMVSGDLDRDGAADLAVGFATRQGGGLVAIHHGNMDAFAPHAVTLQAIAQGNPPAPYQTEADLVEVPVQPDFLATGDVFGQKGPGLVVAARGGSTIGVLARNASGKMEMAQSIAASGTITALSAHQLQAGKYAQVVVGTHGLNGAELDIYSGSDAGLSQVSSFALASDASSFVSGNLDGDGVPDLLVVAGGQVSILHGASQTLESVRVPYTVSSAVLGRFVFDRNGIAQISLLATDGSVHVLAESGLDARPFTTDEARALRLSSRNGSMAVPAAIQSAVSWNEVESYPAAATFGGSGQTPMMFRTRLSGNGADDILVLSYSRASLVEHSDVNPASGVVIERTDLAVNAAAALTTRVNFDARPGLIYVPNGGTSPVIHVVASTSFFPNRTDDPTPPADLSTVCTNTSNAQTVPSCSLREAVLKANANTGATNTITLASATYQLSIAKHAGDYSGKFGALYLNSSMNIVGQGSASTIIQGGASAGHGVDLVVAVNEDISTQTTASVSITGVTIQFGTNQGTLADGNGDQDGGGMMFDTGKLGTSTLSLTDVVLNSNQTTDGDGGGIALFSSLVQNAGGASTFTNCVIQTNSTSRVGGLGAQAGGIWVSNTNGIPAVTTLNTTTVTGNQTKGTNGIGGGIKFDGPVNGHTQSAIHGGTISNNTSTADGGGIYTNAGLTIDMETVITGNSAGTSGGGIWINLSPDTATFSNITVTANSASGGNGGGIYVGNSGGQVTVTYSRLTGNIAVLSGEDLFNATGGTGTKVTATDDWWGSNSPGTPRISSASVCPATAGTICFNPFIVFTLTADPSTIKINTTSTLTASVLKDSANNTLTSTQAGVFTGLPTGGDIFSPGNGSSVISFDTETISSGIAQEIYTAGSSKGSAQISATLDNQTLSVTINVVAPPTITKSFNPATVAPSGKTTITFGLSNPNAVAIDASFTDTFPSGMAVASTPNVTNTCGGTPTATALAASVGYTNAALAANTTCSITVDVTAPATGQVATNSVTLNSSLAGNSALVSANLTVISAPQINKSFTASLLLVGNSTTLTLTVSNPNATSTINGIAFTDTFPSGLTVAATPALNNTCSGTPSATAGGSSVSLAGASLTAGTSCVVTVSVTGVTGGAKMNSVTVTSTNAGTGNTSSATVTVLGPPTLTKGFAAASIPVGQSTTLTFTLNNPDVTSLTGVGFTDTLPAGLMVSSPSSGLTNTCGGAATASGSSISLSGVTLAATTGCSLSVSVTGIAAGAQVNTTSAITSNEAGNGATATASINVIAAPSIAAAFNPTSIAQGATTTLTLTITNPAGNPATLMGVAVTDTLPVGLTVATSSSPTCGGTLATTNPTTIQLTGASIAAGAQCIFAVTVTGAGSGQYLNTTGAVTSSNGGTGNAASASLTVAGTDLTVAVTNAGFFSQGQFGDEFILTVSNVGSGPTNGSLVTVADTMPSGFTVTQITASGWSCTTAPLQCTRTDALAGGASYPPITISVNISQTATSPETNTATVSGGGDNNPANNSGSDTVTILQPGQVTLTGLITARSGASNARLWTITVTNTASAMAANAEITGLTLTQTSGTACTPVLNTTMPVMLGTIGPSSTATGTVTIDFSSCTGTPRFRVAGTFIANGGVNTGSMTLNNQVQ